MKVSYRRILGSWKSPFELVFMPYSFDFLFFKGDEAAFSFYLVLVERSLQDFSVGEEEYTMAFLLVMSELT
jgi:hypothetical protein